MLTETTLRVISIVFGNCCSIKCVPFEWDKGDRRIRLCSGRRVHVYKACVCYTLFNATFLISSFVYSRWKLETRPFMSSVFHAVYCCAFSVASLFHLNNWMRRKQLVEYVNQFLKLMEDLEGAFKLDGFYLKGDLCERTVLALSCLAYVDCCLISILFVQQRSDFRYLYGRLGIPRGSTTDYCVVPFFWLLALWDAVVVWHVVIFNMLNILMYFFTTIIWLKEINPKKRIEDQRICKEFLRSPHTALRVYRCHQVLNKNFNSCFSPILLPLSLFSVLTVVITCNVLSIRFQADIPMPTLAAVPFVSFYCMAVIHTTFPTAAAVNTLSIQFIREWKSRWDPRMKKSDSHFQSCRPLRVRICPFFCVEQTRSLKILNFCILYTCKALLLFRGGERS